MGGSGHKAVVAMSGGVDSSVAAWLLLREGYEVTGIHLSMGGPGGGRVAVSPALADARRAAETLGIELVVVDASAEMAETIDYFVAEYARGRTPNPCIRCNARVKFPVLVRQADRMGARFVATGHHARIVRHEDGPAIHRAAEKDQSYALFVVDRGLLERVLLPVGQVDGKVEARRIARRAGLHLADKPDSQEICFVDGDHVPLLRARRPEAFRPGEIVDSAGKVVGRHEGVGCYTIGQRRGLGVAAGSPMYVTRIDPAAARITIGPREETLSHRLTAGAACWHIDPPAPGSRLDLTVQIRYNHPGVPGRVLILPEGRFVAHFAPPASAVTPGQAAVLYEGPRLLGGGWIE